MLKSNQDRILKIQDILRVTEETRISWDSYGMLLANAAALRSEDPSRKVGCCAMRHDNSIASMGYNGAPSGVSIDWSNRNEKLLRVIHAEANCLKFVLPGEVDRIYVTHSPCINCLSLIAGYKIKKVYYGEEYPYEKEQVFKIAEEFGICLKLIN